MNTFSYLFLAAVACYLAFSWWLKHRHIKHVSTNRDQVPEMFRDDISLPEHQKAADYTVAKSNLAIWQMIYGTGILLMWTFGGGLQYLDTALSTMNMGTVWGGVTTMVSYFILGTILYLPFSVYSIFTIEEKFGFNRMTPKLFIGDLIKQTILGIVIMVPLFWIILKLMSAAGQLWWLYVWLVVMGFLFLTMWAYPTIIAPMFNKFKPLDNEELKNRIDTLLEQCGFKSNGVFVMDGSKRSSHGNAYFGGIGNSKRVVFFDTLLKQLEPDEMEAVLAHELGHFRLKHVTKQLIQSSLFFLAMLAVLGWMIDKSWFYAGLNASASSGPHIALLLYIMIVPVFTFLLDPLLSWVSRKHEFEADNFAAEKRNAAMLISALVKLNRENASTLTPDPLHSMIYDSHPPAMIRINNLLNAQKSG